MILLCSLAWASTPIATWDLQQDNGGFTSGGELGQWAWGIVGSGPGSGYDGSRAWAVGLNGVYLNDAVEYLELPLPDLSSAAAPVFTFAQWYSFGAGDYGYLEVDEGAGFHGLAPVYGYPFPQGWAGTSSGWQAATAALPTSALRVRFVFVADTAGVGIGWFIDNAGVWDGDVTAPRVSALDALPDTEDLTGPYVVGAEIDDDTRVLSSSLVWSTSRGAGGQVVMVDSGGGLWQGELPAAPPDTVVSYHISATDGANSTVWPTPSENSFRVYLPAPSGLTGPTGRVVATEVELEWAPPVSVHPVLEYDVLREGEVVATVPAPPAIVPLLGGGDTFSVRAVYAEGAGDESAPWSVNSILPSLVRVSPAVGYAGDRLWVELYGDHAQFVDGEIELDFGSGIATNTISVRDVDRLVAELEIDENTMAGDRTVSLTSPVGTLELQAGFQVNAAADRPRLTSVDPDAVTQGERGELRIEVVGALADTPEVNLGPGVVVESVTVEGQTLRVSYAAAITAPLGDHAVTADDGVRRLDGVNLRVVDWSPAPVQTCATGEGAPSGAALLAAAALARRRRKPTMPTSPTGKSHAAG